ncbi:MAG: ATP-binding cassette domain-containing protein [Pseudomonadota bacterium]
MTLALNIKDLRVEQDRQELLAVKQLQVPAGQALGIQGPSGAGKSTLLFALAGLLPASSGRILWGETEITALSGAALTKFRADFIGMIFQDYLLFDELSAFANASLTALFSRHAERHAIRSSASSLLEAMRVPNTKRSVASFSGGERQRVAVARAMAKSAPIILADEPTANLQRQAADALAEDLVQQTRVEGTTLIVVSHDEAVLARMDRVVSLSDGRLS